MHGVWSHHLACAVDLLVDFWSRSAERDWLTDRPANKFTNPVDGDRAIRNLHIPVRDDRLCGHYESDGLSAY